MPGAWWDVRERGRDERSLPLTINQRLALPSEDDQ